MWDEQGMGYTLGYVFTNIFNFNVGDIFLQDYYELRIYNKLKNTLKFELKFFGGPHLLTDKFKFNICGESLKDLFQFYIDKKHLPYEIKVNSLDQYDPTKILHITVSILPQREDDTFKKGDLISRNTFDKISNITNV